MLCGVVVDGVTPFELSAFRVGFDDCDVVLVFVDAEEWSHFIPARSRKPLMAAVWSRAAFRW